MRLIFFLLPVLFPLFVRADIQALKGVDVSLVSENRSISAGQKFTVALKIRHHESFHTYWKNPGIAGVPTEIVWQLPAGFSAGEIQWPYPEHCWMAVHPVHGYERDVMLLVDITPPAEISATQVGLKATASWMACADGCYPGKITFDLELPVSLEPIASADAALFLQARLEVPTPLEGWHAERLSVVDAAEIRIRLKPHELGNAMPDDIYLFSSDGQISSDQPQRIKTTDGVVEIITKRSNDSPSGKTSIPGVLMSAAPLGRGALRFATIEAK